MLDNHSTTALVTGGVLTAMAAVYLAVGVGTGHWFEYDGHPGGNPGSAAPPVNVSLPPGADDFERGEMDELAETRLLAAYRGTLGLWERCICLPQTSHWFRPEPKVKHRTVCVHSSLHDQFTLKFVEIGNHNSQVDLLRTYLTRSQFLLPLVGLALMLMGIGVGMCACSCRSLRPILAMGAFHLLAGLSTLACVVCFAVNLELLHSHVSPVLPAPVTGVYGWSFGLATVSVPLQVMAGTLYIWAGQRQKTEYLRVQAYRLS